MTDQELIERVATEVMGRVVSSTGEHYAQVDLYSVKAIRRATPNSGDEAWNPLDNITHMDMVLERMREREWFLKLEAGVPDGWFAIFCSPNVWGPNTPVETEGEDTTAMFRAILLAALDAVEHG